MSGNEVEALGRAHQLFAAPTRGAVLDADPARHARRLDRAADRNTGVGQQSYRAALAVHRAELRSTAQTDAAMTGVITAAHNDHVRARELTRQVVEEARADAARTPDTPLAHREAMRRRVARLRTQQAHVRMAQQEALRHRSALRGLRYRSRRVRRGRRANSRLPLPGGRAGMAVRAALSRLGRPYVWGATGPNQFDCSGLTQWAYAQAGLHLDRTTYEQIHAGIAVPRAEIRPGDLVFPNPGHVQLAIGRNRVIEAPHSGATVRISPLGTQVAIRRPSL
ncbi:MAG TPA: C40 family peptidase [Mycobacterium sp.]|nr:C40 family peptidase [Mycobacterium sp.]